ncbi:MAG: ATP-binding protein [Thiomargarita sp.]|nr:ATP-binding protein [Thiomargarita sp.]
MLLQFIVKNFMCFAEETIFSMVANAECDEHQKHLITLTPQTDVLRTSVLYGANAHGKTKLIEGINFAKQLIVKGISTTQDIPVTPFRLDKQLRNEPSQFEFIIFYQNIRYHYGFIINNQRVFEEWLFVTKKREMRYFERVTSEKGDVTIEIGGTLARKNSKDKQFLEFVAQGTRPNQLFLTEAIARNVKKLKPLYDWFDKILQVVPATSRYLPLAIRANKEKTFMTFLSEFLKLADTGIQDIRAIEEKLDYDKHFPELPEHVRLEIENQIRSGETMIMFGKGTFYTLCSNQLGQSILIRLETMHHGHDGSVVSFDFSKESAGTQQLTHLLPILIDLLSNEKVYIIDELDLSLHVLLSKLFLEAYLNKSVPTHHSQLVFTTHETHLLDVKLLRKDEIWFLEKDEQGASHLYSLANLKLNANVNIQKGYLQGRFGGIPFIGDLEQLDLEKDEQEASHLYSLAHLKINADVNQKKYRKEHIENHFISNREQLDLFIEE